MKNQIKKSKTLDEDTETLLATVSHDLKNPVISVIMALKTLDNPKLSPLNDYQKEILDNVLVSLHYMKRLITNVLDAYRFDNKALGMNKTSVDFEEYISSILQEVKYIFADRNQTIRFSSELKNKIVELDCIEIERVVNNLVANSSIYSPQGSEIKIRLFENGDRICLSMENEGRGIANPENIFDKFVIRDPSNKTVATGLGLYIVKEIITAHGGEVYMESEINKFTRVTFELPRK